MIVALTGNIGSGKSTAADIFRDAGFFYINADAVGHELYQKPAVKERIVSLFGEDILTSGQIDRSKLKKIVFSDAMELQKLNAYVHPLILKEIEKKIDESDSDVVIEGALIIEAGWNVADVLVLITADKEKRMQRLHERGKYTQEEIRHIMDSQMPQEEKLEKADYIIDNSGSKEAFVTDVKKLIAELS